MKKVFKASSVFAAVALVVGTANTQAGTIDINENTCNNWFLTCNASIDADTANVARSVSNQGNVTITADTDNSGGEGVWIRSQADADNITGSYLTVVGGNTRLNAVGTNTINAATNDINGTTNNINGTTNINTTGASKNTVIGNVGNDTYLNSAYNDIGAAEGYDSFTTIGNNRAGTTINAQAGNASMSLANGSASTNVTGGVSQLTERTGVANVATSSQVLLSNGGGAKVDANGKLSATGAAAAAPTVGVTLNNGYGNTNGMVITESQSVLSGGTAASSASSLSMNDSGARFSNAATGAPVTVTGVADGKNDFDAVNVRQFAGAIAAVAAQANVPALAAGQTRTVGIGLGNFMSKTGLALGMNLRGDNNATYKLSVSTGLNGGAKAVIGAGAAWAF